ncbi:putative CMGC protein kinase [Rosellinia necatrix]|uniref:Putative CMGC protein kinase n=1 Tax=Rosellinia necatrix TaxID=77044 RepID=A0A1W2TR16_ROSNE|nr:putative CMGC protein kinase [Rosellinia necatrix]
MDGRAATPPPPLIKSDSSAENGEYVDWDSDEAGEIEINAEPVEKYQQGCVYYPIRLGDILDNRYCVKHKLGHGGFSTVWMAQDKETSELVALKVLVSGKDGETEFNAQKMVKQAVGEASHIVPCQRTFEVQGNHGNRHHVLVMPALGPNLDTHYRDAPIAARMQAAFHVLKALKTIHEAKLVHRDLNRGAVMWEWKHTDNLNMATHCQYLGRPRRLDLSSLLWKPGDLVRPVVIPPKLTGNTVYLGDFGMAARAGAPADVQFQTPAEYCAPERYHNVNPSSASDMWSYMCIFATLYLGFSPFYGLGGNRIMELLVNTLGPLPPSWEGRYQYHDSTADDAWYDQARETHVEMTLESKLARRNPAPNETEKALVLSILRRGFYYDPQQRISAAELLEDKAFIAIMEKYGCMQSEEKGK